jgi:hypothetical protein
MCPNWVTEESFLPLENPEPSGSLQQSAEVRLRNKFGI